MLALLCDNFDKVNFLTAVSLLISKVNVMYSLVFIIVMHYIASYCTSCITKSYL